MTAQETTDRIAELESMPGVMIEAYMPNFSDDAVWRLASWSEKIADTSPSFAAWLHGLAVEEIYRRGSTSPVEAKTPRLPTTWSNLELADSLIAIFAMAQANQSRELDAFLGTLSLKIAVQAAERLRGNSNG